MSKLSLAVFLVFAIQTLCAQSYGIGRPATEAEIESLDVTIGPEGRELPDGSGSVQEGAQVYEVRCKECHGESGAGGDHAALVGNPEQLKQAPPINCRQLLADAHPGSITARAMPCEEPGTLTDDQNMQSPHMSCTSTGLSTKTPHWTVNPCPRLRCRTAAVS